LWQRDDGAFTVFTQLCFSRSPRAYYHGRRAALQSQCRIASTAPAALRNALEFRRPGAGRAANKVSPQYFNAGRLPLYFVAVSPNLPARLAPSPATPLDGRRTRAQHGDIAECGLAMTATSPNVAHAAEGSCRALFLLARRLHFVEAVARIAPRFPAVIIFISQRDFAARRQAAASAYSPLLHNVMT
jgi:hypothetical protein